MLLTVLGRWSRCCSCSVWLCGLRCGALRDWSCPALCLCVASVLLAFWSPCLGRGGRAGLCACRAFVCWLCSRWSVSFFSLPPGVGGWQRLLLVTLPGMFCLPFLYGVKGTSLRWLESYLSNRSQCIVDGLKVASQSKSHGSVLGPVMFLIFINDMPLQLRRDTDVYADDTITHTAGKKVEVVEPK